MPQHQLGAANLAGKYRLLAELGQGGMATVYLAVALGSSGFRKLAVVKLLQPEIAVDEEFVQMFLDEARLCARLAHPNIVHIYDVGVDDVGHLMAMEYLDGVSLHGAIAKLGRNGGPLTFPLLAKVLLEVLEGLRYAHELQDYDGQSLEIVHRDVTPHNIFVTYDGQVKLLDFGIAKAATSSVRTATGVIKGKVTYMAPEQARGEHVDARADLYAVGVMLWEAVTGCRRWPTGLSQPALFALLSAAEPPESPNAASYGYPAEIDAIVLKALAPKPEDRFQTAGEFRAALEQAVRSVPAPSLRELGAMLADAFAEGRKRMRAIIEEQFRAIDSGAPSVPRQLPAVWSPSSLTGSEPRQIASPLARTEVMGSQSIRVAVSTAPEPPSRSARWRIAAVGGGLSTVVALLLFVASGSRQPTGTERVRERARVAAEGAVFAATATLEQPMSPSSDPSTATAINLPPTAPPSSAQALVPAEAPLPAEHGRPVPLAGTARTTPTHASRAAHETTSAPPMPSPPPTAPAAAGSPANDGIPLRRPDGKPKVQLERDNPWP